MNEADRDTLMRLKAFDHVRRLCEVHDHLTANELKPGHLALSRAYGSKGMYPEAIAEARRALELNYGSSTKGYLGLWLIRSGKRDEGLKLLSELKEEAKQTYVQGDVIALIYLGLGDKVEALNWLEKHMSTHAETANAYSVSPQLDELRDEPRFKAMPKRMNLPE